MPDEIKMQIVKTPSFQVGDKLFATIEEAQIHALNGFLIANFGSEHFDAKVAPDIAARMLENKETLVNLLTMRATSHPGARKANGAVRKKRTPRVPAIQPPPPNT